MKEKETAERIMEDAASAEIAVLLHLSFWGLGFRV